MSVLRASGTECRHETEESDGQADSPPRRAPAYSMRGRGEKEGRAWGGVAYSGITAEL